MAENDALTLVSCNLILATNYYNVGNLLLLYNYWNLISCTDANFRI